MKRRLLALALALGMLFGLSIPAAADDADHPFSDIEHWSKPAILWGYHHEPRLVNGTDATTFSPDGAMNRGMFVTLLHRYAGSPAASGTAAFTDVGKGTYYAAAVDWAVEIGVVNGTAPNTFSPSEPISRQNIATMLYRYVERLGVYLPHNGDLSLFPDFREVAAHAKNPLSWCLQVGVINGKDGKLAPKADATRGEVITMVQRFDKVYQSYALTDADPAVLYGTYRDMLADVNKAGSANYAYEDLWETYKGDVLQSNLLSTRNATASLSGDKLLAQEEVYFTFNTDLSKEDVITTYGEQQIYYRADLPDYQLYISDTIARSKTKTQWGDVKTPFRPVIEGQNYSVDLQEDMVLRAQTCAFFYLLEWDCSQINKAIHLSTNGESLNSLCTYVYFDVDGSFFRTVTVADGTMLMQGDTPYLANVSRTITMTLYAAGNLSVSAPSDLDAYQPFSAS